MIVDHVDIAMLTYHLMMIMRQMTMSALDAMGQVVGNANNDYFKEIPISENTFTEA